MKKNDRLPYEGLSRDYIYARMCKRLKLPETDDDSVCMDARPRIQSYTYTSEDARSAVEQAGVFWRIVAKVAFPLKNQIKRLPVIGPWAIAIKESFLNRGWNRKDLSSLLELDVNPFIRACYRELLEREADEAAFQFYQGKLCCGMPKEGLIYLLGESAEFGQRFSILHFSDYRKQYRWYRIKNRVKRIPVLSHVGYLLLFPRMIHGIRLEYGKSCADLREAVAVYRQQLNTLDQEIRALRQDTVSCRQQMDYLQEEQVACGRKVDALQQEFEKLYGEFRDINAKAWHEMEELRQGLGGQHQEITRIAAAMNQQEDRLEQADRRLEQAERVDMLQAERLDNIEVSLPQVWQRAESAVSGIKELSEAAIQYDRKELPDTHINNGILGYVSYLEQIGKSGKTSKPTMDIFYEYVAELFRGDAGLLRRHMEIYIPYIKEAVFNTGNKTFVDIGCGKGEFLTQLQENGVSAIGVDMNTESVQIGTSLGRKIVVSDGQTYLEKQPAASLAGVSMFQVAEHMTFEKLFAIGREMGRTVATGGYVLIETINSWCYSRAGNFHIDPSHSVFPSQDGIKLMLEMNGFVDVKVLYYAPIRARAIQGEAIESSYEGFCVIGRKADLEE